MSAVSCIHLARIVAPVGFRRRRHPTPTSLLFSGRGSLRLRIFARRQAVFGFDLEAIRLRPSGLGRTVGVEPHHSPLQISALEPETYVVKVHGGIELGKFSKQSKRRHGLCSSAAANQISDIIATK